MGIAQKVTYKPEKKFQEPLIIRYDQYGREPLAISVYPPPDWLNQFHFDHPQPGWIVKGVYPDAFTGVLCKLLSHETGVVVQMPFLLRKTETRGTVNSTKVRIS